MTQYSEAVSPKIELGRMSWVEVEERVKEDPLTPVIVLFSATEQHGYHLPLNTDQISTWNNWFNAAKIVKDEVKPILTPLMPFGVEWEHMGFPGTITLSTRTLTQVAKEIIRSLYMNSGLRKFVIIPGCGGQGHNAALRMAMHELFEEFSPNIIVCVCGGGTLRAFTTPVEEEALRKKLDYKPVNTYTGHGGESETSVALFLHPEDVNMEKAVDTIVPGTNQPILPEWINLPSDTEWEWYARLTNRRVDWPNIRNIERGPQVGPVGSIGYATNATAEKGEIAVNSAIERIVRFLIWFKKLEINPKPEPKHRYHYRY